MKVTFIPGKEINSDLGVVNAARVSLHKHHKEFNKEKDTKLIQYLAKHNHWTPFAHSRLYFEIRWKNIEEELHFYRNYNPAGFGIQTQRQDQEGNRVDCIKGSLYSWLMNISYLSVKKFDPVYDACIEKFPVSTKALLPYKSDPFYYDTGIIQCSEAYCLFRGLWDIVCATLLIKVPIFVARQIRTSQVGFAYSDLYVENESFVFNEVSRRYVDEEPEFYRMREWRVREGGEVKQGSTGVADYRTTQVLDAVYNAMMTEAEISYQQAKESSIAPEQARALLPQSMYTEFYMTGTLKRWAQFLKLRLQPDVQQETREIASSMAAVLFSQFPPWGEAYRIQDLL